MLEVIVRNERDNANNSSYWVVEIQDRDSHGPVKNSMRIDVQSENDAEEMARTISENGMNIRAAGTAIISTL